MRRVNKVTVSNGTMFEQDLEILFQRSNLLLARFQLVSELPEPTRSRLSRDSRSA